MKKTLFCLALLIFTMTFACAPKKSETKARMGVAHVQVTDKQELKRVTRNWRVQCASASDCPDYVAQMITMQTGGFTLCTATLISPDMILTNSHCFDAKTATPEQLCKTTTFVFADQSPSGTETATCKEIVSKSKIVTDTFTHSDTAVLRLDHALKRKPVKVSRAGLKHRETFEVFKIDPNQDKELGELKSEHCTALQGTAFLPSSSSDSSPVMVIRDCDITDGNSGSPLINKNGEIAATAFASLNHDPATQTVSALNGDDLSAKAAAAQMARAANLACLELAGDSAVASSCQQSPPKQNESDATPNLDPNAHTKEIFAAVRAASRAHKEMILSQLGYGPLVSKDNGSVQFAAWCFNNPSQWLDRFATNNQLPTSAKMQATFMQWNLSWTLDDDLKAVPQLTEVLAPQLQDIELNPAALRTSGASPIKNLTTGETTIWKTCPARTTK